MKNPALRALAASSLTLLSLLATTAHAADPAVLAVNADQIKRAGIATARVTEAKGGAVLADGLRLPGTALYPSAALRVVSAPAAGTVESLPVDVLAKVNARTVVAVLRSPQSLQWQREYLQARLQSGVAADRLKRDEALYNEGIIAQSRLHESRAAAQQADAARRELQQMLALAGVSSHKLDGADGVNAISPLLGVAAPQAGVVLEYLVGAGQYVEAGAPLAKIGTQGKLWLELQATRAQGALVKVGDEVTVDGCAQPGRVSATGTAMQADSQTMTLRAELPAATDCLSPNQRVEARVKVRLAANQAAALQLPASALVAQGGKDYVFLREAAGFRPVPVEVVLRDAANAMVRGSLKVGDEVASSGVASLKGLWLGLGAPEGK